MKWRSLEESTPETDLRPLREIFAERKELIAKYVPAETQSIHARAVSELKRQKLASNILPIGAKITEFQLQDHDGKTISSSDLLAKGRLVLCFIRGRWCPFCVGQMEAMNLVLPEVEQAGATFATISPQTVKQSFFMRDQHKLRFPLLSDGANNVARQFGLTYHVPDEQKAIYQRAFVNLPFVNGDEKLGVADSCNVYHRSRRDRALRVCRRRLHGAARTGGHCGGPRGPQWLKPVSISFLSARLKSCPSRSINVKTPGTALSEHSSFSTLSAMKSISEDWSASRYWQLATGNCPYELYLRHQRRHRGAQGPGTGFPMGRHGEGTA